MLRPEIGQRGEVMSANAALAASLVVFGLSVAALLSLGHYLRIVPGSPFALKIDILFSVDGAERWKRLTAAVPPRFLISHPLLEHLWGRVGAALSWLLRFAWTVDAARFLAATGMVCAVAAVGFGGLAAGASRLNPRRWNMALLFPVCLLFTANTIVVQPDHFSLSFGLLVIASLALLPGLKNWTRAVLLGIAGVLAAVTTVTNALFPALVAAIVFREHITLANARRFRYPILAVVIAAVGISAVAALVAIRGARGRTETRATMFLTLRLVRDPLAAARFAGSGLLYPAVGPVPSVSRLPNDPAQQSHQSYETSRLGGYGLLSGVAACAWVALLAASSIVLIRSPDLRNYCYALFGWIAFNLVFHNLWGDEFFLYSAHWSWALMLIVLLGSRALPTWAVAAAVALIIPGQLSTLSTIRALVFA